MATAKFSALKLRNLIAPGRYGDGGGLWLQVRDADHRSWLYRYTLHGRARQMGLGSLEDVSLAEARELAREARKLVRQGVDPIERRRTARGEVAAALTFREVADRYLATHEMAWRNAKHRYQWRATLKTACEVLGRFPVNQVDTGAVMRVLEPMWHRTPETASRLRGRIEVVLDYAKTQGWRTGENPARWRGHLKNLLPATSRIARVQHHAALPWTEIGAFMAELQAQKGLAARALEFTILVAGRTGEVLGARWPEINLPAKLWTVPGERMKTRSEHRVPLSDAALAVLRHVEPLRVGADGLVFPGTRKGRPLGNMSMKMLLRRMGRGDLTVHGFRNTFRDWVAEATSHEGEAAEAALAHTLGQVERAYQRGKLFAKRKRLMGHWAKFCAPVKVVST